MVFAKKLSQAANLSKNEEEKSPEWFFDICLQVFQWCSQVISASHLLSSKVHEILVSIRPSFNMCRVVFTPCQGEEHSQGIWAAAEKCKAPGCQKRETWKHFSKDRHSTQANSWPRMRRTLRVWSGCSPGVWPQRAGTPFVHFLHRKRHRPASHQFTKCLIPAPGSSLQTGDGTT